MSFLPSRRHSFASPATSIPRDRSLITSSEKIRVRCIELYVEMESFCVKYSHNSSYIYIYLQRDPQRGGEVSLAGIKMESLEGERWFISLISNHANLNHDRRRTFLAQDGWSRGVAFSRWFYLPIVPRGPWIPLRSIK